MIIELPFNFVNFLQNYEVSIFFKVTQVARTYLLLCAIFASVRVLDTQTGQMQLYGKFKSTNIHSLRFTFSSFC